MIEEQLYALISGSTAIATTAGVGDRIYPNVRPQGEALPAIRYLRVAGAPQHHLSGVTTIDKSRFQFDCYGATYGSAKLVAAKLRNLLNGYTNSSGSTGTDMLVQHSEMVFETDTYEQPETGEDIGTHRVTHDYEISFKTT